MKPFSFCGADLVALPSGALLWPAQNLLTVSDLHLGKSERIARRSGQMLPPYETLDTLTRLQTDLDAHTPEHVICLGDSFDDLEAGAHMPENITDWITRLMAGRSWTWIEGNHDPGPLNLGGSHRAQQSIARLTFRHIAQPAPTSGEVSGHYHPKASLRTRGRTVTRPCFLYDQTRLILPAYGTYTGGLRTNAATLQSLMAQDARAILTGASAVEIPMPRS
ncbi:putative phosphoesterase [Litoreibacter meonggei]|uniref:Putative phosphoesterase n=1 Tax=Litoreibacter meonggei TaxID=1049199 RepID=A0A497X612_9RHOB|nr:ligase-associated DNA damage response endonuclease PdeM [Litoreibacter meonggei]RLJ60574.1 putative phosphoesterase [Litoreibacter meonggei]